MSVTEKVSSCTTACIPRTDDSPGCGCGDKRPPAVDRKLAGAATLSALSAVACTSCCVLPFVLPAVVLANVGGAVAVLDHAHVWATRTALVAVACAWGWTSYQTVKTKRRPRPSSLLLLLLATTLTIGAASWPRIEPLVFHALGITKQHGNRGGV